MKLLKSKSMESKDYRKNFSGRLCRKHEGIKMGSDGMSWAVWYYINAFGIFMMSFGLENIFGIDGFGLTIFGWGLLTVMLPWVISEMKEGNRWDT